jgi:hypothetical protein
MVNHDRAIDEVVGTLIPRQGRLSPAAKDTHAAIEAWLQLLWDQYWFHLQRQFTQQQVIPQAVRFLALRMLNRGLPLFPTVPYPDYGYLLSVAQQIAYPGRDQSIVAVVTQPDGPRPIVATHSAAPGDPLAAMIIDSITKTVDALKPPTPRKRGWTAMALMTPLSPERLADALPHTAGSINNYTGEIEVDPEATIEERRFLLRAQKGREQSLRGERLDLRLNAGRPSDVSTPEKAVITIARAKYELRKRGLPDNEKMIESKLDISTSTLYRTKALLRRSGIRLEDIEPLPSGGHV